MSDESRGVPPPGDNEDEEPAVLGAAPTLPLRRETRAERLERRRQQRDQADVGGASVVPSPPESMHSPSGQQLRTDVVYVFEPHTKSIPPLRQYLEALWERRKFLHELAKSELRQARANTALGALWSIIDPLFQASLYYFIFTVVRDGQRPSEFLHILIADIMLFQFASGSLTTGGNSVRKGRNLMLSSTFPRALLPIGSVYQGMLKFLPAIPVIIFMFVVLQAPFSWAYLLLPLLFALMLVMSLGIALLASTLVVFFRDVTNLLRYTSRILFFITPVIYPVDLLPPQIRPYLSWQPFFALFDSYQRIFSGGVPSIGMILQVAGWATVLLVWGGFLFIRHERDFAGRL